MHDLYMPLTSKYRKFQPQSNFFPGHSNSFSITPTVVWVKIFEKANISFSILRSYNHRLGNRKQIFCH